MNTDVVDVSLESLFAHISRFATLSDDDKAIVRAYVQVKQVKNREYIHLHDQPCVANYFVAKGCVRMFFPAKNGVEQIVQFAIDNWWISDYMSFETQRPSKFDIQAVEHTHLVCLNRQVQDELFARVPALERYFRQVMQRAFAASQMRIHFIWDQSGEERYTSFQASFPEFVQRVPQYMLASYLGFTPEFLSKIRAKRGRGVVDLEVD